MKLSVDALTSITDWVVNAPSTITVIQEPTLIAGLNTSSLMIKFDSGDVVRTATKTFSTPIDVSDYESLVFSIWSSSKGFDKLYIKPADFSYKIKLDATHEYYIPVWSTFSDITIGIEDVTAITQIQITPLFDTTDYIVISEMIAEKEQIPYDILAAVKEHIDHYITQRESDGILLGTIDASVDDEAITFLTTPNYLDRYGVIKITDGVNTETHQVEDNDGLIFQLNDNIDGNKILNDFTGASVFLQFTSFINPGQYEIRLPGMSIWGIEFEPILQGAKLDTIRDSFLVSDGTSKERTEGQILKFPVAIDCEARSHELIDRMARAVRIMIADERLWINGRKHDIYFSGAPTEMKPTMGVDIIPKITYSLDVEVKENIYDRQAVPVTSTINIVADVLEE